MKSLADDYSNVAKMMTLQFGNVESIVGNRKCWLPVLTMFAKVFIRLLTLSQTSPDFYVSAAEVF